jgi:uncharacterized protein YkwD
MPRDVPQAIGFVIGVWIAIVLLWPIGARGDTLAAPRGTPSGAGLSGSVAGLAGLETDLAETVNEFRQSHHLEPLARLPALDAVARAHSADMAMRGYFSHDTPEGQNPVDRIHAGGVTDFALAGENVGMTSRARPNSEVFHGWLASHAHYQNLVAPAFNATGVGIARRADGTLFYTQVYVTFPR